MWTITAAASRWCSSAGGRDLQSAVGTELTNRELRQLLLDAEGTDWAFVHRVTGRFGHDLRYSVEIRRVQAELEYKPLLPFEQGLADVAQRYRDNRA